MLSKYRLFDNTRPYVSATSGLEPGRRVMKKFFNAEGAILLTPSPALMATLLSVAA